MTSRARCWSNPREQFAYFTSALYDELRAHAYTRTHTRGQSWGETSLHRTHLLDLSHNSSSPFPVVSTVDVADGGPGGGHGTLRKLFLPDPVNEGGNSLSTHESRVPCTRSSGWAARPRARTRRVRVIARRTFAHVGTATPFAHDSVLPTIARDTRLARGTGRPRAPLRTADGGMRSHASANRDARRAPFLSRPPPRRRQDGLSPTRFF